MEVKFLDLNSILEEAIYVQQSLGYEMKENKHKVYKLKKGIYGLKQTPRAWYRNIDLYMIKEGFNSNNNESTLYVKINHLGQFFSCMLMI